MALQKVGFFTPVVTTTSAATLFTGAAAKTHIRSITFHNTSVGSTTVTVHLVKNSGGSVGTAATANKILVVNLAANETFVFDFTWPATLVVNDTFQGLSSVAGVNVFFHGDTDV